MARAHNPGGRSCALLLGLVCGCGDSRRGEETPTHAAKGRVFVDQRPAGRVVIVFHPLDANAPKAQARSDADGYFQLSTFKPHDGAAKGSYAVTCVLTDGEDGGNLLPERYASPKTSGLRAEIKEGSNQVAPFYLSGR